MNKQQAIDFVNSECEQYKTTHGKYPETLCVDDAVWNALVSPNYTFPPRAVPIVAIPLLSFNIPAFAHTELIEMYAHDKPVPYVKVQQRKIVETEEDMDDYADAMRTQALIELEEEEKTLSPSSEA